MNPEITILEAIFLSMFKAANNLTDIAYYMQYINIGRLTT